MRHVFSDVCLPNQQQNFLPFPIVSFFSFVTFYFTFICMVRDYFFTSLTANGDIKEGSDEDVL